MATANVLGTLETGLRLIELLNARGSVTVEQARRTFDLSRSSAYRLLRTLVDAGWAYDAGRGHYRLEPGMVAAAAWNVRMLSIRDVAYPYLQGLSERFEETATLSIRIGRHRAPIAQVISRQEIAMQVEIGRPWPLYAGASGRAILAAMDPAARERWVEQEPMEALTPATVVSKRRVLERAEADAKLGYSAACGERDRDAFSIAAALRQRNRPIGSLAVCGPRTRFSEGLPARIGPAVAQAAGAISASLDEQKPPAGSIATQPEQ